MTDPIIDAFVHPAMRRNADIKKYMPPAEALRKRFPTNMFRHLTPTPTGIAPYGEWIETAKPGGDPDSRDNPGSDPHETWASVSGQGAVAAVLLPLTRGMQPNVDDGSAICAATNDWLAEEWLTDETPGCGGTIRVNAMDPDAAAREIERWAGHPRMVQVGVTLEAHRPYGQRNYLPMWQAAVDAGLPIAIKADGGAGVDYYPTQNGFARTHIEFNAMHRDRFFIHLASFIAEGVFERLPGLKVQFVDGGFDLLAPLMWRMDMDYPISYIEVPWVKSTPSEYLKDHVRFVADKLEEPYLDSEAEIAEWVEITGAADLLVFGSRYPHWSTFDARDLLPLAAPDVRRRILFENAAEWYGARLGVTATA